MSARRRRSVIAVLAAAATAVLGCAQRHGGADKSAGDAGTGTTVAFARIEPTQGNQVKGTVTFEKVSGGIRVLLRIDGLRPGLHGFHVHANGDCSAPDASSAGDHFGPPNTRHGDRYDDQSHVGDMGNIVADETGHATLDYVDPHIALEGASSIVGRAVIVHANEDDLRTQPSGNSGPRVGCGVIEAGTN